MISPNQGSILSHDSSLKWAPWDNYYILGYEGPNENLKEVPDRAWNLISVVKFSYLEGEMVTHGSLYKFAMMNILETSHLGKLS